MRETETWIYSGDRAKQLRWRWEDRLRKEQAVRYGTKLAEDPGAKKKEG